MKRIKWTTLSFTFILGCCSLAALFDDIDIQFTLKDIKGVPSSVKENYGWQKKEKSVAVYKKKADLYSQQVAERHLQSKQLILAQADKQTKLPDNTPTKPQVKKPSQPQDKKPSQPQVKKPTKPQDKKPSQPQVKKPTKPSPPQKPQYEDVPFQNLVLRFVNPKSVPVSELTMSAKVITSDQREISLSDLKTNSKGELLLEQIGPLPAVIEIDFQPVSEWRFQSADHASIRLDKTFGSILETVLDKSSATLTASLVPKYQDKSIVKRKVVYLGEYPELIVVERLVVDYDIFGPMGTFVSSPAFPNGETLRIPDSGKLELQVPLSYLELGPLPVRFFQSLPGGEAEAVVDGYEVDPYESHSIRCPELRLVRLNNIILAKDIDVLHTKDNVVRSLGDITKKKSLGKITKLADGSEWWEYTQEGIAVQFRETFIPGDKKKGLQLVERIRMLDERAGRIGELTPGVSVDSMYTSLGIPEQLGEQRKSITDLIGSTGAIDTYLDNGVRICRFAGKVNWIELTRPALLLSQGTTAFVQRPQARLFIDSFKGNSRIPLQGKDDLEQCLARLPSVKLVDSADNADLILTAEVVNFTERQESIVQLIPFKYQCSLAIKYSLYDKNSEEYVVENKVASSSVVADYSKEFALGAAIVAALLSSGDIPKEIKILLSGVALSSIKDTMRRAVNRSPSICTRSAFNVIVQDISQRASFTARVVNIDYQKGLITLNVGKNQGVKVSSSTEPHEFEIFFGNASLPFNESSFNADYYSAVVIEVGENQSVCQLKRKIRKLDKGSEQYRESEDMKMVQKIPSPSTGLVWARSSVHFPPVEIVTTK